jgi:hypothetical protein
MFLTAAELRGAAALATAARASALICFTGIGLTAAGLRGAAALLLSSAAGLGRFILVRTIFFFFLGESFVSALI